MTESISPITLAAIKAALRDGLQQFRRPPPMAASAWADQHGYIVPTRSGSYSGPIKGMLTQFQLDLLDIFADYGMRYCTVRKASRLGVSLVVEHYTAFAIVVRKRKVIVYAGTTSEARDTEKEQYGPLIRMCKPLRDAMLGNPDKQGKHNSSQTKLFKGAALYIKAIRVKSGARRISGDTVILEEYETMVDEVDGEGSVAEISDSRIRGSANPQNIRVSSPGTIGSCKITKSLEDADCVLSWFLPAPCCGELIHLKWGGVDAEFGIKFDRKANGKADNVRYRCQACEGEFNYQQMLGVVDEGRWQTQDGSIWFCRDTKSWRDAEGIEIPRIKHPGIDQDSLISKMYNWLDDVEFFLRAMKGLKIKDFRDYKTWTQTVRGQAWEDMPDKIGKAESYLARAEHYAAQVPKGVRALFAGGDMQKNHIEITIWGYGADEEKWAIEHIKIDGHIGTIKGRKHLKAVLQTIYETEDGRYLHLTAALLDSGYRATDVHSFCRETGPAWCYPGHGTQTLFPRKPIASLSRKPHASYGTYYVEVGGDDAKARLFQRLAIEKPGNWETGEPIPGYMHFPVGRGFTLEYFKQFVESEVLVSKYDRFGNQITTYHKITLATKNESLDTAQYAEAAYHTHIFLYGFNINQYVQHQPDESSSEHESAAAALGERVRKRQENQ